MPRLGCDNHRWGAVDDPETGELIQLDKSHPMDVCQRCVENYSELHIIDDTEAPNTSDDSDSEEYLCGVNDCKRTVDNPDDTCWQHP